MFHILRKTPNKVKEGLVLISKFSAIKMTSKLKNFCTKEAATRLYQSAHM